MYLFQAARRASSKLAFRRLATSPAEGKQPLGVGQTVTVISLISVGVLGPGMYLLLTRPRFVKD
ncbi:Hypothetical predicted protein [Paramuricea clavata]|uniref:Uncharacterized protein n=1 Tax=Paramuricea clavata TaxID=317549 RepID=A0A6S7GEM6_PARCT|nr:Hypothetical predicted protein [Paramuricea clavata]